MVFNVVARNCDDHTKNFAFLMDKKGGWKLSPAYDICHAYRPGSPWVSQQSLSVNGKRLNITTQDFLEVAKQMNIKRPEPIIAEIVQVVGNWANYAAKQKVPDDVAMAIKATLLV